jgi:glycoprotein-N-acetylgalactosamine 3-beta-galactosyltransferase
VHDHYVDDFDYFVLGTADTYMLVNNLREYLASPDVVARDTSGESLYLGRRFALAGNMRTIYNSAGPGYVLNKAALKVFAANFELSICSPLAESSLDDILFARCFRKTVPPIQPMDTRDVRGAERFHQFPPMVHMTFKLNVALSAAELANTSRSAVMTGSKSKKQKNARSQGWYPLYSIELQDGMDCCAPSSISFHGIDPDLMYRMDALLVGCRADHAYVASVEQRRQDLEYELPDIVPGHRRILHRE